MLRKLMVLQGMGRQRRDYEYDMSDSWAGSKAAAYKIASCFDIERKEHYIMPLRDIRTESQFVNVVYAINRLPHN